MITETKMGDVIFQEQSTYYVYENEDQKKKGIWLLASSNYQTAAKFAHKYYHNISKK